VARSKIVSMLLLVLLVAAPSKPAPNDTASSRFYFPHFASGQGTETTFIISNSSAQDADVRITAFDDDGRLIAGTFNPATIMLAAQSQARINAGDLFKLQNQNQAMVVGWAKAESANPQLSAWLLMSMDSVRGDKIDGIGVSDRVADRMVFSAVFQGPDIVTGIALSNPDDRVAHVKASLYSEGAVAAVREFQLPGYGHRGWLLSDLFTSDVVSGHVEIESDVALVGLQEFSQARQWSAVPMQVPEEALQLILPLPSADINVSASIALANPQDFDMNLSLTAWSAGSSSARGPVRRVIKTHSEFIASMSDLFGDFPTAGGFLVIRTDAGLAAAFGGKPILTGLAILERRDSSGLASFALAPARDRETVFSPLTDQTAVAIVNAQDVLGTTRLSMIAGDRGVAGEVELPLNAVTSISQNLMRLTNAKQPGSLAVMGADVPLATLQIESSDAGFLVVPGQTFKSRETYSNGEQLSRLSGGIVTTADGFSLSVPMNALKEDAGIQINAMPPQSLPPVDATRRLLSAAEFLPKGLEFRLPATTSMPLVRRQRPGSLLPVELLSAQTTSYQPSGFIATVAPDGRTANATISHFSIFALTVEKPTVSMTASSTTVEVNQTVQFTATVSGNNDQGVEWFVNSVSGGDAVLGRITADGLYTAPASVPGQGLIVVKAVSVDDPEAASRLELFIITPEESEDAPKPDPIVLTGPVDPSCAVCHPVR
jgi:hypothetical protein